MFLLANDAGETCRSAQYLVLFAAKQIRGQPTISPHVSGLETGRLELGPRTSAKILALAIISGPSSIRGLEGINVIVERCGGGWRERPPALSSANDAGEAVGSVH